MIPREHINSPTPKDIISKLNSIKARETAQYIADMTLELRNLTKDYNMKALQGLLEVAFYEASSEANRVDIPPEEIEHLNMLSRASHG